MILFYLQPSWSKQQPSCDVENGSYFRADFEAVAIKSSDAIVKKLVPDKPMKFVGWSPAVQEADTYFTIPLAERNKGPRMFWSMFAWRLDCPRIAKGSKSRAGTSRSTGGDTRSGDFKAGHDKAMAESARA